MTTRGFVLSAELRAVIPFGAWREMGKAGSANRTHFVLDDSGTLCRVMGHRYPQVLKLAGPWREPDTYRHLCGFCRDIHPTPPDCMCGRCQAKRTSDAARAKRILETRSDRWRK